MDPAVRLRRAPLWLLAGGMGALGCGPSSPSSPDGSLAPRADADRVGSADSGATRADAAAATCGLTPPGEHAIRVVYLVPSDRSFDQARADALWSAVLHTRDWYAAQSGGESFRLQEGVELAELPHEAAWYATHDSGGGESGWFGDNVLADAMAATGAQEDDAQNRWLFFIDADQGCGQVGRKHTVEMAVLNANDLRRLAGEPTISPCSGEMMGEARCPSVGFLGFVIGTSTGLHYPDGCADDSGNTPCLEEWLFNGADDLYPEATLAPDNKERLAASPFFEPVELSGCPDSCSSP